MESNFQRRDEDVFVSSADLAASRPPPNRRSGLRDLLRESLFQFIVACIYIVVILGFWAGSLNSDINLKQSLLDVELDITIPYPVAGLEEVSSGFLGTGQQPFFEIRDWELTSLLDSTSNNLQEGLWLALIVAAPFALIVSVNGLYTNVVEGIPTYRNIVFLRNITEVIALFALVTTGYTLATNLEDNFSDPNTGLRINFRVLQRDDFGVEISQGPNYQEPIEWLGDVPVVGSSLEESDYLQPGTYTRALMTGLFNTLRVVSIGLVFATILGVLIGVGLLSGNWLVRSVATVYVEIFRNTPLLVQLFLVYGVWINFLPVVRESISVQDTIFLNSRGINYPKIIMTDTFWVFMVPTVIGFVMGIGLMRWRGQVRDRTGEPARSFLYFAVSFLGLLLFGLGASLLLGGLPLDWEKPILGRFNFEGGDAFTAEFVGLLISLVLYTAAFIADIVRAGIQSVPKGQIEAARAAGLSGGQTLQLVVLPQAFRLIVPPLTNQYLNLSKNSSLAIAIGYVDLFSISQIATNQSGQPVVFFAVVLVIYLLLSLIISLVMNLVNRSLRLQTR